MAQNPSDLNKNQQLYHEQSEKAEYLQKFGIRCDEIIEIAIDLF